jgi:hypothetical protein
MKKRILTLLIAVILVVFMLPLSAAAAGSLYNFERVNSYYSGLFTDVPKGAWYEPYVGAAYEYDLVNGKSARKYDPNSNLVISEAVKIAACIHSIYYNGYANFSNGNPWYQQYVDYAVDNGIIDYWEYDYNDTCTRADFARIFANALPDDALWMINEIYDGDIPDVDMSDWYGPSVYTLYQAGVLTGSDDYGSFKPDFYISRAEVATISIRMADSSYRQYITLGGGGGNSGGGHIGGVYYGDYSSESENNDSGYYADYINDGDTYYGILDIYDVDYYTFDLDYSSHIYIACVPDYADDADWIICELLDAYGNVIDYSSSDDYYSYPGQMIAIDLSPGTYYIGVYLYSDYPYDDCNYDLYMTSVG